MKLLKKLQNSAIYMITNQPWVAVENFPLLTLERAHEVSQYIVDVLKRKGGHIDGYYLYPHAHPGYVKKKSSY